MIGKQDKTALNSRLENKTLKQRVLSLKGEIAILMHHFDKFQKNKWIMARIKKRFESEISILEQEIKQLKEGKI